MKRKINVEFDLDYDNNSNCNQEEFTLTRNSNLTLNEQMNYISQEKREEMIKDDIEKEEKKKRDIIENNKVKFERFVDSLNFKKPNSNEFNKSSNVLKEESDNKKTFLNNKKQIFKFEWDNNEDTSKNGYSDLSVFNPKVIQNKKYDDIRFQVNDVNSKNIELMNLRDWKIYRENFNITVKSDLNSTPNPIRNWDESSLTNELIRILKKKFETPTPIQKQIIPIGLKRKDCIGISPTGSGKSLAFLIPIIHFLMIEKMTGNSNINENSVLIESIGPLALVLAPTRDLAQQIEEEFNKIVSLLSYDLKSVCIIGGKDIDEQYSILTKGVDLVVGAPGRIKDCIKRSYVHFSNCSFVIIDEADKMISDGYEEDIKFILNDMNWQRYSESKNSNKNFKNDNQEDQTLMMFSATMSHNLEILAKTYLLNPCHIQIIQDDYSNIKQMFELANNHYIKQSYLKGILKNYSGPIIIFVNSKVNTNEVYKYIEKLGYSCVEMHGDKSQDQRELALKGFKNGEYNILISTSLVGRGIDIDNVNLVINYDTPNSVDDYEHRIGRTGRAGNFGTAFTFIEDKSSEFVNQLVEHLSRRKLKIPNFLKVNEGFYPI